MNNKKVRLIMVLGGLFLFIDQFLKWQATYNWQRSYLLTSYFGWQPFANKGVAFSFPVPTEVTIFITIPIILLIIYLLVVEWRKPISSPQLLLAWTFILLGALSNFTDRLVYSHVVDYILLGMAVINLADIMIVSGLAVYMIKLLNKKSV